MTRRQHLAGAIALLFAFATPIARGIAHLYS